MRFVDTHCHLDHHEVLDVDTQVTRARAAGVVLMVTVGTDVASSRQAIATAERVPGVWAAVGIHPNDADGATVDGLAAIAALAAHPRVVAVGETGLDHHWDRTRPDVQEAAFRAQVSLAREHDLALVVHCREAWPETLAILEDADPPERVVLHCFSGDHDTTRRTVAAGWFHSFAGPVTFTNAAALRAVAATVPPELLLTETDAPYLTPHPHRGTPNDPSYVPLTLRALAALHARPVEDLAETVLSNALRAFRLTVADLTGQEGPHRTPSPDGGPGRSA